MYRHQSFQEPRISGQKGLFAHFLAHHCLNELPAVARCLDGQFRALPDDPAVFFPEGGVVGLAEYVGHVGFGITYFLEGDPDEGEEPHHPEQVAGSGVVLLVLLGRLECVVVVAVEQVDEPLDLQPDEGEESGLSGEQLVVAADDGHLFLDVGEGDAEEGVQGLEDEQVLVEDVAEGLERDLLAFAVALH
jgi:hypothetical protein